MISRPWPHATGRAIDFWLWSTTRKRMGSIRIRVKAGRGSTTLAKSIDLTSRCLPLLLALAFACSRSVGAAPAKAESPDNSRFDAGRIREGARQKTENPDAAGNIGPRLPRVETGDCPAICDKLLLCKEGPFDSAADCATACEAAIDDPISAKTYRCLARATECKKIKSCGH
jgi:hypothetical protein